jgi:hypothetical protein
MAAETRKPCDSHGRLLLCLQDTKGAGRELRNRIGPTCGVKAALSERRVTSTSTCSNFLVESTAFVGPSDRPSHTHSFTHQPHEDMPYVPFRCHLKADGNSHEFGVD